MTSENDAHRADLRGAWRWGVWIGGALILVGIGGIMYSCSRSSGSDMKPQEREVARRESLARKRISEPAPGTEEGAMVRMFVAHHLSEIEPAYWVKHFGSARPSEVAVIKGLILHTHWSPEDESGMGVFDFTLPGDVTTYKLAVYFASDGTIDHLTMES